VAPLENFCFISTNKSETLFWVFFSFIVLDGSTLRHLHRSYNVSNISYMNLPLLHFSFTPLYRSPLSLSPDFWSSFNRCHFFIYIYVYTILTPYLHSYSLSPTPSLSHYCHPSPLGRTCPALLYSDFVEEERENEKHDTLGNFLVIFSCINGL
jgi:hypothetical protein